MLKKIILWIFIGVITLWGVWGVIALSISQESGEQMGLLGQMAYYFIIPNIVWVVIAYILLKHFSIDEIKTYMAESSSHRKKMEEKMDEILKKLNQ
jgi:uncharacterized membrane protein